MSIKLFLIALFCIIPPSILSQAVSGDNGRMAFTTPEAPWAVVFNAKNFKLASQQIKPDGRSGYFLMNNDVEHYTVSLWIEPVEKCKTSKECRDLILNAGNPGWGKFDNLVKAEFGDISYFEFYRPEVNGIPVKMLDMYAEFVKAGYWIDLHISKPLYTKADHVLFERFVKSALFETKTK